jgi:hypothetical protein
MKIEGWIMLIASWAAISGLCAFAIARTLRARSRDLSAPLDIEAQIEEEDEG